MENKRQRNDDQFFRKTYRKVGKAIRDYQLIGPEDRIVVGLSGGKDSLALLDILAGRQKYADGKLYLKAIHIVMDNLPLKADLDYLKEFCNERNVELIILHSDSEFTDQGNACFICSWNRRKLMFGEMQKINYPKLALGHHMDDAIETLLMNMAFQGSISSMPAKLKMFDEKIEIIRPLLLVTDEELLQYARLKGFRLDATECPFGKSSGRAKIKNIAGQIYSLNPNARSNLFASMGNVMTDYLPEQTKNRG